MVEGGRSQILLHYQDWHLNHHGNHEDDQLVGREDQNLSQ